MVSRNDIFSGAGNCVELFWTLPVNFSANGERLAQSRKGTAMGFLRVPMDVAPYLPEL